MTRDNRGFALIDIVFCIGIIGLLCGIALPRLLLAKQAAGSSSAIGAMRAVNSAELTFAITCGNGFYAPNLTTLGTPPLGSREAFITPGLGVSNAVTRNPATSFRSQQRLMPVRPQPATGSRPAKRGRASRLPPIQRAGTTRASSRPTPTA